MTHKKKLNKHRMNVKILIAFLQGFRRPVLLPEKYGKITPRVVFKTGEPEPIVMSHVSLSHLF